MASMTGANGAAAAASMRRRDRPRISDSAYRAGRSGRVQCRLCSSEVVPPRPSQILRAVSFASSEIERSCGPSRKAFASVTATSADPARRIDDELRADRRLELPSAHRQAPRDDADESHERARRLRRRATAAPHPATGPSRNTSRKYARYASRPAAFARAAVSEHGLVQTRDRRNVRLVERSDVSHGASRGESDQGRLPAVKRQRGPILSMPAAASRVARAARVSCGPNRSENRSASSVVRSLTGPGVLVAMGALEEIELGRAFAPRERRSPSSSVSWPR